MTVPASIADRTHRAWRRTTGALRQRRLPCCICGQPIDYSLPPNHGQAFTAAHRHSVKTHPHLALDPTNVKGAAHRDCNASEGTDGAGLTPPGPTSSAW